VRIGHNDPLMKVYCDTSVLVAASVSAHPHHAQSLALLSRFAGKARGGYQRARHRGILRSSYPGSADSTGL